MGTCERMTHDSRTPQDPIAAYVERVKEEIIAGVVERLRSDALLMSGAISESATALQVFYTAKELAQRWHFSKADTIYDIPEIELPRRRVGVRRGKTLFYWLDVLAYEGTITRDEAYAIQERKLAVLEDSPQAPARLRRLGNALDARQK